MLARLKAEIPLERRHLLSRGELAKLVDTAVQNFMLRQAIDANALERRDLVTALLQSLLNPSTSAPEADAAAAQRRANRAVIEAAKALI